MPSFTDNPTHPPTVVFPNPGMQALSSVIHLFGASVLAYCFARRTTFPELSWTQVWSTVTWPRLCVILVLADSWIFIFLSGILIFGSGLSHDTMSCSLGIFACIALYALSKILTYAFLMEKVHVVWGGAHHTKRLHSPVYRICLITMLPYIVVVVLMLLGRIAYLRSDGACIIGLKRLSSLCLLVYDLYINVFLTAMFIWPLARSKLVNPRLKAVATRTLIAAFVALSISTLNIAILTVMHGQQLGWVCLGSCGTDVTVNAIVLFWVTSPNSKVNTTHSGPGGAANVTGIGHDHNLASQNRALSVPGAANARRASTAVMLSPIPPSPNASNMNEKKDGGLLSPNAWKARFSYGRSKEANGSVEMSDIADSEPPRSPGMRSVQTVSPRKEVWDEPESTSYVVVNDRDLESGSGVMIGTPPIGKKRSASVVKVVNGPEVNRGSVFGRVFGNERERDRGMEVTVTVTTQMDTGDDGRASRISADGTSVGGAGEKSVSGDSLERAVP